MPRWRRQQLRRSSGHRLAERERHRNLGAIEEQKLAWEKYQREHPVRARRALKALGSAAAPAALLAEAVMKI
jgi:hypothetical protein